MLQSNKRGNELYIKTLTGEMFKLKVGQKDTILSVKKIIEEQEGIPADQQILIFAGKILLDERWISDYGIQSGTIFHLVIKRKDV